MTAAHSATAQPPVNPVALSADAAVIGLVGLAHLISHYSQLLLAPLFPLLKDAFQVGFTELGFLMTIFFVVSCAVQAGSGFVVDRLGPRPILFAGLALLGLAAFGFAASTSYAMLAAFSVLAGAGNGVFHPVDYTLLNRRVSAARLGHAYSVHGITGSLGWALAPAMLVPLALAFSWRVALVCAGLLACSVLLLLLYARRLLELPPAAAHDAAAPRAAQAAGPDPQRFAFLRIPAVWMCFAFFLLYAAALNVVQAFAPEAARQLHAVLPALAGICVSVYMLAGAGGMVLGGFLAADPERCERIVGCGFGLAALVALLLALARLPGELVPVLFGVMGFCAGIAGPARDLLVKRSTPEGATGRVYGIVYSGLDIGQALAPLLFGMLLDQGRNSAVLLGLALLQALLIASAFHVRKVRKTPAPVLV